MVPKYPFIVRVTRKTGKDEGRMRLDRSFETFGAACVHYNSALREALVTSVQIMLVLDELHKETNGHPTFK